MLALTLLACDPDVGDSTIMSAELFPFDGERTSTFVSTDETLPYKLVVTSVPPPEVNDTLNVYTVHYVSDCVSPAAFCADEELATILWASREGDGVLVFGFDDVELDPPVRIANDRTHVGDVAITETGGITWTSTMEGTFECPIAMNAEWDSCVRFRVEADGEGGPLAGTWWATRGNGVAAFEPDRDTGRWELEDVLCEGDCDGRW